MLDQGGKERKQIIVRVFNNNGIKYYHIAHQVYVENKTYNSKNRLNNTRPERSRKQDDEQLELRRKIKDGETLTKE